jgi:hypothetical protein
MANLSQREKRTVRIAGLGLAAYLILFCGFQAWRALEARRATYEQMLIDARRVAAEVVPYENRVLLTEKLKRSFRFDPRTQTQASLVAEASAAIQNAARSGGIKVGTLRESSARPSARELASMQFEGMGPVPAILALLHQLGALGYPLIVDSVAITSEAAMPGMVKLNLTIIILDFDQWQEAEVPRA